MVAPGGSGLKRNSGIKKNILFAIKKGELISLLNVVVFIIAQTKSQFFFSKILLQRYQMNPVARLIIQMEFGVLKNSFRSLLFTGAIKFVY